MFLKSLVINKLCFIDKHQLLTIISGCMGNDCTSRDQSQFSLAYFIQKYGQQPLLCVAQQNIRKQAILKKIPEISEKYKQEIHKSKIITIREVNTLETQIYNQIQNKIKQIEKQDTGQITNAQNHHHRCAQQLLGREEIRKDFSQLRKQIMHDYELEQQKTKQKIDQNFQKHIQEIQKQKNDKFSEYDQITDNDRACIRKEMNKRYKRQLKDFKRQIQLDIESGNVIDMVNIKDNFAHIYPTSQLKQIRKKSQKLMQEGQSMILSKDISDTKSQQIIPPVGCWGC